MHHRDFVLEPDDAERLANLAGPFDAHLRLAELRLGVQIANRGNVFRVSAEDAETARQAERFLQHLYADTETELLDEQAPSFDPRLDPKCCWALRHPEFFPVEVNRADYEALLRVPGLGVVSARRILTARRTGPLRLENLPKLGVVMKRAQYFLTANGRMADGLRFTQDSLLRNLIAVEQSLLPQPEMRQLSLFDDAV